jgi:hypothetical protein
MTGTTDLPRKLRKMFSDDGERLTWAEMRQIINEAAKRIDYYEKTTTDGRISSSILEAHDDGYDRGYQEAMSEIISIIRKIKKERLSND